MAAILIRTEGLQLSVARSISLYRGNAFTEFQVYSCSFWRVKEMGHVSTIQLCLAGTALPKACQ